MLSCAAPVIARFRTRSVRVYWYHVAYAGKKILINLRPLKEIGEERVSVEYALTDNDNILHNIRFFFFFEISIETHLFGDETKFREFFRLNWDEYNCFLVFNRILIVFTPRASVGNKKKRVAHLDKWAVL